MGLNLLDTEEKIDAFIDSSLQRKKSVELEIDKFIAGQPNTLGQPQSAIPPPVQKTPTFQRGQGFFRNVEGCRQSSF